MGQAPSTHAHKASQEYTDITSEMIERILRKMYSDDISDSKYCSDGTKLPAAITAQNTFSPPDMEIVGQRKRGIEKFLEEKADYDPEGFWKTFSEVIGAEVTPVPTVYVYTNKEGKIEADYDDTEVTVELDEDEDGEKDTKFEGFNDLDDDELGDDLDDSDFDDDDLEESEEKEEEFIDSPSKKKNKKSTKGSPSRKSKK